MLGVFAEFETNLRRERQMEGIVAAKTRGVYKGRKATIRAEEVRRLRADGLGATEIADRLGIGRASVYRVLQPWGERTPAVEPMLAAGVNPSDVARQLESAGAA
jgi:DNA invertase Pin-like site-specific DNA recombinase